MPSAHCHRRAPLNACFRSPIIVPARASPQFRVPVAISMQLHPPAAHHSSGTHFRLRAHLATNPLHQRPHGRYTYTYMFRRSSSACNHMHIEMSRPREQTVGPPTTITAPSSAPADVHHKVFPLSGLHVWECVYVGLCMDCCCCSVYAYV